jgi:protein-disulfide isomerase
MRSRPFALTHPRAFLLPVLLLAPFLLAGCGGDGDEGEAAPPPPTPSAEAETEFVDLDQVGYDEGDVAEAPVRIIEFSDFGCVFCARFHEESYGALHDEFVAAGDVAWKYVPITVGGFPNGFEAALAAECVGEQEGGARFPRIRDRLYETRLTWLEATPEGAESHFRELAQEAGAEMGAFDACLEGEEARDRIETSNLVAAQVGVQGTPTFLIQDYAVQGAPAFEDFQRFLRDLVREIREGPDGAAAGEGAREG